MCTGEYFYKNNKNKLDGLYPYCKRCASIKAKEWTENNPEKRKESYTKYNRSDIGKERTREYGKIHRSSGRYLEWQRSEKGRKSFQLYQAKRNLNKKHKISKDEWIHCKNYFNNTCAYCGVSVVEHRNKFRKDLAREHAINTGKNDLSNCIPSCFTCNSSKRTQDYTDWYSKNNINYDELKLIKIEQWLNGDYLKYIEIQED